MNVARILELADVIEKTPHAPIADTDHAKQPLTGFNMGAWHCQTVGCIAGWAIHLYPDAYDHWEGYVHSASVALEMDEADGEDLFEPFQLIGRFLTITPAQAAQTLRKLAETGKVDWSHVEARP